MNLKCIPWRQVPGKNQLRQLYRTAFPKEERLPWWVLKYLSLRRDMGIYGFYRDGQLWGFTCMAATEKVLFVLFFAVPEQQRGCGCGSAVLQLLKREFPGREIVLNVELPESCADNYAQRLQRMRFYRKNGFFDTGMDIDEVGGTFRVLSTAKELDVPGYLAVFSRISYGLWKPYIRKGQNYTF